MLTQTLVVAVLSCSRIAVNNMNGFDRLPADGATAPRSTWIWANADSAELLDGQTPVDVVEKTVSVSGEDTKTLVVLQPRQPLAEARQYTVRANGISTTFTTSSELDTTTPALPSVSIGTITGPHYGAYSCGSVSEVNLSVVPAADITFVTNTTTAELPAGAFSLATGTSVRTLALSPGDKRLNVITFDLSGNAATSNEVPVTVPQQTSGCAAAPAGPALLLLALALSARASSTGRSRRSSSSRG